MHAILIAGSESVKKQIEVLRLLWSQESVTYHGAFHAITDAGLNPLREHSDALRRYSESLIP